jgi:hypothetical protein
MKTDIIKLLSPVLVGKTIKVCIYQLKNSILRFPTLSTDHEGDYEIKEKYWTIDQIKVEWLDKDYYICLYSGNKKVIFYLKDTITFI